MGLKKCKQTADNVYVGSSSTLSEINSEKSASWGKAVHHLPQKLKFTFFELFSSSSKIVLILAHEVKIGQQLVPTYFCRTNFTFLEHTVIF